MCNRILSGVVGLDAYTVASIGCSLGNGVSVRVGDGAKEGDNVKWQTNIIIFVICLNIATGLVCELNAPGTEYVYPSDPETLEDYEGHYNLTEIAEEWKSDPLSNVPLLGDIYYGFQTFFRLVSYVFVGFPTFLYSLGDYFITDATALAAYHIFTGGITAMFFVVMAFYIVWFISGRDL